MDNNEKILHRLRMYLYDNPMPKDGKRDFIARIISEQSLSIRQVCKMTRQRGGSDITASAMEHAVELFLREMAYNMCDGYSVNLKWFFAAPCFKGTFDSIDDNYDPVRHKLMFEFHQSLRMRREMEHIHVEIVGQASVGPQIYMVTGKRTGSVDRLLTPSRNAVIKGRRIKITGSDPSVGIRFHSQDDPTAVYTVSPEDIIDNKPSELMIVTPDLPSGYYKLEIATQYARRQLLKEPRSVMFCTMLQVNDPD
jgi:hypothetical protein